MKVKVLNIIDDKTFKAISTVYKKHPKYGKYVTTHKKYLVDSTGKTVKVGDEVEILQEDGKVGAFQVITARNDVTGEVTVAQYIYRGSHYTTETKTFDSMLALEARVIRRSYRIGEKVVIFGEGSTSPSEWKIESKGANGKFRLINDTNHSYRDVLYCSASELDNLIKLSARIEKLPKEFPLSNIYGELKTGYHFVEYNEGYGLEVTNGSERESFLDIEDLERTIASAKLLQEVRKTQADGQINVDTVVDLIAQENFSVYRYHGREKFHTTMNQWPTLEQGKMKERSWEKVTEIVRDLVGNNHDNAQAITDYALSGLALLSEAPSHADIERVVLEVAKKHLGKDFDAHHQQYLNLAQLRQLPTPPPRINRQSPPQNSAHP